MRKAVCENGGEWEFNSDGKGKEKMRRGQR